MQAKTKNEKTNTNEGSVAKAKTTDGRKLTSGEINLLRKIFGNAIDYKYVRIHNGKLIPGIQPDDVSITPWGEIYMPNKNYQADFSIVPQEKYNYLQHFIHEMSHVWQYQRMSTYTRGSIGICGAGLSIATAAAIFVDSIADIAPQK